MLIKIQVAGFLAALFLVTAYSQEIEKLDIGRAVDIALGSNPALQAAAARTRGALGLERQAGLRPNPSLIFDTENIRLWVAHFYAHESCGQCTPCREGCGWMERILHRIERGEGRQEDMDLLLDVASNILGSTICPLGDAAAMPVASFVTKFRPEFQYHVDHKKCRV